jgi:hypothetical protein
MAPLRFIVDSAVRLRQVFAQLAELPVSRERPLEIVIRSPRKDKTHDQRKLWHAVLADIALDTGYTPAQIKTLIKEDYYGRDRLTLANGRTFEVLPSSEDEDRSGYSRLIDFTYDFCAQNDISIPERRPFK